MNALEMREMSSVLLLFPLGIVLGLAALFVIIGVRWTKHRHIQQFLEPSRPWRRPPGNLALFDQPTRWLAIKGSSIAGIQHVLGLHDPVRCSLEEGLSDLRDQKLFISAPIAGWILVIGSSLPDPADDIDQCFHQLTRWSRKLGHLQFFSVNRVLNHHAWAIVDQGQIFRAYSWAGETLWNQGCPTAAERELRLRCLEYGAVAPEYGQKDLTAGNSENVHKLAARWSVDPSLLLEGAGQHRLGFVASFSQSKPH